MTELGIENMWMSLYLSICICVYTFLIYKSFTTVKAMQFWHRTTSFLSLQRDT